MSAHSQTGTLIREQLSQAAQAWVASGLDRSQLLSGERLKETEAWVVEGGGAEQLSQHERDLLVVSRASTDSEQRLRTQRLRVRRRWIWALALFAVAMTIFASVASRSYHSTEGARNTAASRTVALEARQLQSTDPALASQLALVAYRLSHTPQAKSALIDLTSGPIPTRLSGPIGGPTSIALGDDGHRVAAAYTGNGEVRIYSLKYAQLTLLATLYTEDTSTLGADTGTGTTTTSTRTSPTPTVTNGINTNSTTLTRTTATLNAVAISPNGDLVAAGGTKDRVVVWNVSSPAHPGKIASLHVAAAIASLSFSPDGTQLAAAEINGSTQRWSVSSSVHPRTLASIVSPHQRGLRAVAYNPDGKTLTEVGANGQLTVLATHGPQIPIGTLSAGHVLLTSVVYNAAGTLLAAGTSGGRVQLWTVGGGGKLTRARAPLRAGDGSVDSVAFSQHGSYLSAGGSDGSVRTWSTGSWRRVFEQGGPAAVSGLAFTDGNRRLLSIDVHGTIRLTPFSPSTGRAIANSVSLMAYTQDAARLALISGNGRLQWWNTSDEWGSTPSGAGRIPAITGSQAGGDVQALGPGQFVPPVPTATDPDPAKPGWRQLATVNAQNEVQLWAIAKGRHARLIATLGTGGAGRILGLALSPDGQMLAAATTEDQIVLWQLVSLDHPLTVAPRIVARFGHFSHYPFAVTFAPNSHVLIAGGADETVELWNVTSLDQLQPVSDDTAPKLLTGPLNGPTGTVRDLAVSPDGKTLAASTRSGQVWLWGIGTPARTALIGTLTAATGDVSGVAFSPSDNTLAAISDGDHITFWHYRPFEGVNRVCAFAGSPINLGEWDKYVPSVAYDPPCQNWVAPVLTTTTTTPAP